MTEEFITSMNSVLIGAYVCMNVYFTCSVNAFHHFIAQFVWSMNINNLFIYRSSSRLAFLSFYILLNHQHNVIILQRYNISSFTKLIKTGSYTPCLLQ